MDRVEIDMDMERMIQEAYDNGYLRGYKQGKTEMYEHMKNRLDDEYDAGDCTGKSDRPKGEMKYMGTYYKCSVCGGEFNDEITFMGELNYCPSCGCSWEGDDHE